MLKYLVLIIFGFISFIAALRGSRLVYTLIVKVGYQSLLDLPQLEIFRAFKKYKTQYGYDSLLLQTLAAIIIYVVSSLALGIGLVFVVKW